MYVYICMFSRGRNFAPISFKFGTKIRRAKRLDEFVNQPDPFIRFKMAAVSNVKKIISQKLRHLFKI